MYEVRLRDIEYPLRVDAGEINISDDPGKEHASVRLMNGRELVFFAPFTRIISVQKVELCGSRTEP